MTQDEAFARITARGIADLGIQVAREEIRTSLLTERLALVEEDIDKIQKTIGHLCQNTIRTTTIASSSPQSSGQSGTPAVTPRSPLLRAASGISALFLVPTIKGGK
jgi:hypothetical protein